MFRSPSPISPLSLRPRALLVVDLLFVYGVIIYMSETTLYNLTEDNIMTLLVPATLRAIMMVLIVEAKRERQTKSQSND